MGYGIMVITRDFDSRNLSSILSVPTKVIRERANLIKNSKTSRRGVRFISLHLDCRAREFESHRLDNFGLTLVVREVI